MVRVPRSQNSHADSLATLASSLDDCIPRMITMELLERSSIEPQVVVATSSELEPSWLDTYITFLSKGSLTNNEKEAKKVQRIAAHFWPSEDGRLYWHLEDHTFCVFILAKLPSFWLNFTSEYAMATRGVDHSCTEP